jgi:hypothetical protein
MREVGLEQMEEYVRKHFIDRATFFRRCGHDAEVVRQLLEAKAAPAIVYSRSPDGEWWSALAGYTGTAPKFAPTGGSDWYAPSAIWWMRRAILAFQTGANFLDAAAMNAEVFVRQFRNALTSVPNAFLNYPTCFDGNALNDRLAREAALSEWEAWTSGAYAVCLSYFSGESCVRKEVNACRIRNHFNGQDETLKLEASALFDLTEQLASVLMPFAPFERASGTPGKAVDRTLELLGLGPEEPYHRP